MPTSSAIAAFFGSFTSDFRPALSKVDKPALIITAKNQWTAQYEAMQRQIIGPTIVLWTIFARLTCAWDKPESL